MKPDGSCFTDHEVHAVLKKRFKDPISQDNTEFFRCKKEDVKAAILAVRTGTQNLENRTQSFGLRPEQREAIDKTMEYFASAKKDQPDRTPKFLWNAKMRFGKTFAAYKLAQKMGCKKVLVLTFKPAVEAAWEEDLMTHIDFEGWQFICRDGMTYEQADLNSTRISRHISTANTILAVRPVFSDPVSSLPAAIPNTKATIRNAKCTSISLEVRR